jgi:HPt (histidine-containing phosphotransfer) domain-containing protein
MASSGKPPPEVEFVVHRPGFAWSQFDLGADLDAGALSVIAELDPTGENGVVEDVLAMFEQSLDPLLTQLERVRRDKSPTGLRFEAHKLYSAAAQVGALRVSRACAALTQHFHSDPWADPVAFDAELQTLYDELVVEIVRVQRKLKQLLAE